MNKAAIYVFRNQACMTLGFTMFSCYFATRSEAEAYANEAMPEFFRIVDL